MAKLPARWRCAWLGWDIFRPALLLFEPLTAVLCSASSDSGEPEESHGTLA